MSYPGEIPARSSSRRGPGRRSQSRLKFSGVDQVHGVLVPERVGATGVVRHVSSLKPWRPECDACSQTLSGKSIAFPAGHVAAGRAAVGGCLAELRGRMFVIHLLRFASATLSGLSGWQSGDATAFSKRWSANFTTQLESLIAAAQVAIMEFQTSFAANNCASRSPP